MSDRKRLNKAIMAAVCGVTLLGGAVVFADHRDDMTSRDVTETDRSHLRTIDLSGGFYDDKHKADDWFYDFYEVRNDRTDPRFTEQARLRRSDAAGRIERDRWADAAYPPDSRRGVQRHRAVENAYGRYYDEPWFYEPRDPAYGMPVASTRDDWYHPAAHDEEYVRGTIQATKQVRNRESGGQDTVALLKMNDGGRVITDLGPTQRTLDFALTQGDSIQVGGQREAIGPYSVLMAHDIKSGVNRVRLNRDTLWREADYRQVSGRVERFRDIGVRPNGSLHRTATIRTHDDRIAIVDIGPTPAENVPANAAPGDWMTASGQVVQVGNYPVLLADRLSINNGIPVRVVRPDAEYVEPGRRPFEASHEESAADPTCVGGGCEAGTVNRSSPRNPHSNATDSNIGSDRR